MQITPEPAAANPDLLALVGSRICHDLTSPLGAIGNGMELLALAGMARGPEMQLIAESVAAAQARIRVFRLAFGATGPGQHLAGVEIASILAGASAGGRITYLWQGPDQVPRADAKLAFLAALCVETALPRGGTITLAKTANGWRVTGSGPMVRLEPALAQGLSRGESPGIVAPAHVQFALLPAEARDQGRGITGEIAAGSLTVSFG
jgi:histidine phosphotransferase ChpT